MWVLFKDEYMSESFGLSKLKERRLLTLPFVITVSLLYKESYPEFVNKVREYYFKDATEMEFYIKEVDDLIDQILIVSCHFKWFVIMFKVVLI